VHNGRAIQHRTFSEHWTESGKIVVLDGRPDTIHEIACGLSIPVARIVELTSTRAVLALWEESPSKFLGDSRSREQHGDRYSPSARSCSDLSFKSGDEVGNDGKSKT
jgi:hypothetical protein